MPADTDSPEPTPVAPEEAARVVFDACVAALWSDGRMAAAERDRLSALLERFAHTEKERRLLRRRALEAPDRQRLLADISRLGAPAKKDLFDRCVQMLKSDAGISRKELAFLRAIRRRCGVSLFAYYRKTARWSLTYPLAGLATVVCLVLLWRTFVPAERGQQSPEARTEHLPVALAPPPASPVSLAPEELYKKVHGSVVTVVVSVKGEPVAGGSGAFIGADARRAAYVLTNRHVVEVPLSAGQHIGYDAVAASGARLGAELDFVSKKYDLALLVVPGIGRAARPLALQRMRELRVGQPVYVVSSPLGLDQTFTSGVISAIRGPFIQTDATIHSGSSGGPLLTDSGLLCGVMTKAHEAKDIAFALPADAVLQMLEERRQAGQQPPQSN